ncbi:MAG: LysM peptidoglycan-binding domain-containing protein [Phycisphaerales bacterium]|nr:LysM peptidoglycan-binding domain-containing protein [Phycisphaerales bacterium]
MTREHKLALIVGFSLVLVVGILISDHLSPASLNEPLETLSFNLPLADPEPFVVPSPRSAQPIDRTPDLQPTNQTPPSETGSADTLPASTLAGNPSPEPQTPRQEEVKPLEIVQGLGRPNNEQPGGRRNDAPPLPGFVPVPDERPIRVTPSTPTYAQHLVQKGETVAGLARRYLGSDERWREIQKLNPGLVSAEGGVNAGVTLKIPLSPGTAQPSSTPARAQERPEGKPEQKPRTDTKHAPQRTYVVKANDTLSQIAQRELGSKNRMAEILKLNQDKISNPDEIYEGLKLVLPAA